MITIKTLLEELKIRAYTARHCFNSPGRIIDYFTANIWVKEEEKYISVKLESPYHLFQGNLFRLINTHNPFRRYMVDDNDVQISDQSIETVFDFYGKGRMKMSEQNAYTLHQRKDHTFETIGKLADTIEYNYTNLPAPVDHYENKANAINHATFIDSEANAYNHIMCYNEDEKNATKFKSHNKLCFLITDLDVFELITMDPQDEEKLSKLLLGSVSDRPTKNPQHELNKIRNKALASWVLEELERDKVEDPDDWEKGVRKLLLRQKMISIFFFFCDFR